MIELPTGLRFSRSAASLADGVLAWRSNGRALESAVKLSRGKLTITLSAGVKQVQITTESPAVLATKALATAVKDGETTALEVIVDSIDTKHDAAALTLNLKPS